MRPMQSPTTNAWRNADELCDGQLADILIQLRDSGMSWAAISRRLHAYHRCHVENSTLADWHRQLTADQEAVS